MVELILGQFLPYIVGAAALIAGIWGYGKKRERDGRREEIGRQIEIDRQAAKRTKEKLDEALDYDRDVSPAERLRRQGRLRGADED